MRAEAEVRMAERGQREGLRGREACECWYFMKEAGEQDSAEAMVVQVLSAAPRQRRL